jgi:hypothetical protein
MPLKYISLKSEAVAYINSQQLTILHTQNNLKNNGSSVHLRSFRYEIPRTKATIA